ncbi:MAG: hypothetical protein IPO93_03440 [Actinobacteria bacterium]|nr:hypothetical protein [Actinomycetota bacterium]
MTNLSNGRSYTVALRARNRDRCRRCSLAVQATPALPPGLDPDKPKKLPKPRVWVNTSFNAAEL